MNFLPPDFEFYSSFFTSRGIGLINASPVGMALLGPDAGVPAWHPINDNTRASVGAAKAFANERGVQLGTVWL